MKRDALDFHFVPEHQAALDIRLAVNWRGYCIRRERQAVSPTCRDYRAPKSTIYNPPNPQSLVDVLDGAKLNSAVVQLPQKHRLSLQWHYIRPTSPNTARKKIGVTMNELHELVIDARQMLLNGGA